MLRRYLTCLLLCVSLVLTQRVANACSIPVFQYALERWQTDPYELLIYHRGDLSTEHTALLERLHPEYVPGEPQPNTAITRVPLNGEVRPEFAEIWQADGGGEVQPWLVVRSPWKGENFTVWKGPLTVESVETILTSPLRAELIRRLAGGDSVVWVFLDGTDAARSERLAAESFAHLRELQVGIQLPEIRPEDLASLSVDPESLGLKFSFLRIAPDAPGESLLIRSLLAVKSSLTEAAAAGEPMLFPIFGRGRVFFPVVGDDIQTLNREDLARFLCGACQCTVKQQNPGLDLLTSVDWDAYVLGIPTEKPLPPLSGLGGFATGDSPPAELPAAASAPVSSEPVAATVHAIIHESQLPPPDAITSVAAAEPVASSAPSPRSQTEAPDIGSLSLLIVGLLTAGVAFASLWLLPRRS